MFLLKAFPCSIYLKLKKILGVFKIVKKGRKFSMQRIASFDEMSNSSPGDLLANKDFLTAEKI